MNFTILLSRPGGGVFRRLLLAVALALAAPVGVCVALGAPVGQETGQALRSIIEDYSADAPKRAKQGAADAFFEFEGSALDRDLAARDPALYRQLEGEWMRLLAVMDGGRSEAEVRAQGERVLALLERGAKAADAGGGSVFVDSLLIILREGFEAILIVSALAAYLMRIGEGSRVPYLYGGAALAVVASFVLWIAARSILVLSGGDREALEGATILLATGVLFWVSYWLVSKAEADRWQEFVKRRVERAVGRGALFGLAFLSFVVVFREGLETVLFYEAVAARTRDASDQSLLVAGFFAGCAALTALYVAFQKVGPRIPMRSFFNVTGGLLYFMAFRFAGAGVRELQEAGILAQTPLELAPDSRALSQWLGVFPYLEPLALQGVLVILALFALLQTWRRRRAVAAPPPVVEQQRAVGGHG
ncbi:MAG TPA: FTR1 family protein [Candidatus Binatia bacterium]|nr:FTR1 family protein [Candidatus Binatia bacterium]